MDLDARLPFLLRKRNIARIEGDRLLIGDRRRYPFKTSFVPCRNEDEVAQAIRMMVTQGGGPLQVALTTLRFTARRIHAGQLPMTADTFVKTTALLTHARPMNTTMARTIDSLLPRITAWFGTNTGETDLTAYVDALVDDAEAGFDLAYDRMSDTGAGCIADGEQILTTCFAEHSFILSLIKARDTGKRIAVVVPETRPYLQGSRLTAPSLQELGIPVELITDGMGAHLMADGSVSRYMTAADLVAMDGTVVNKTGTLSNAICARHYGLPYQVFALSPDPTKLSKDDIVIPQRDGEDVCRCLGQPTTSEGISGRYPAFDIIDASLVDVIITPKGLLAPGDVAARYGNRGRTGGVK